MRLTLRLAKRGMGRTSPNPMVGALVVKGKTIIGKVTIIVPENPMRRF